MRKLTQGDLIQLYWREGSIQLTKEVFKVAVREFMSEYARISELLIRDPDYLR
jgi:hypothetical protein